MRIVRYRDERDSGLAVETASGLRRTQFATVTDAVASSEPLRPDGAVGASAKVLAPVARPGKIFGSGVNFKGHLEENPAGVLPEQPGFFSKLPSSVIDPGDPIVIPSPESQVDWEVELAIVVGKTARSVDRKRALDHVFGYTIVHDVSARDLQFAGDIVLAKGLDSFCPMGPAIVTVEELGEASGLELATYVNGARMQQGTTADWLFDVPTIIEFLSARLTLEPGDVITTGTPAGVGAFRSPQVYLQPGDEVTVEVEGIGRLTNPVVAGWED